LNRWLSFFCYPASAGSAATRICSSSSVERPFDSWRERMAGAAVLQVPQDGREKAPRLRNEFVNRHSPSSAARAAPPTSGVAAYALTGRGRQPFRLRRRRSNVDPDRLREGLGNRCRRCVGPERAGQFGLRAQVEVTEARRAPAGLRRFVNVPHEAQVVRIASTFLFFHQPDVRDSAISPQKTTAVRLPA
jgi:hypothetical protein